MNSLSSKESLQYSQYNCCVWSMNHFRDVKNTEDIFECKDYTNLLIFVKTY